MGLDVYLYRYENFEDTQRREKEYEVQAERNYDVAAPGKTYDQMTEAEKESARQLNRDLATSLQLGEWGEDKTLKQKIEVKSSLYPEHMFEIGYFRSSYNDGGLNRVLGAMGLPSMDELFGVEEESYTIQPDWAASMARLQDCLAKYIEGSEKAPYRAACFDVINYGHKDTFPDSEDGALRVFQVQKETHNGIGGYSCSAGDFYFDKPMELLAMIPGVRFGTPCIWGIYKKDADGIAWYRQAIEIMVESCGWVLAHPESEQAKFYLHWSG